MFAMISPEEDFHKNVIIIVHIEYTCTRTGDTIRKYHVQLGAVARREYSRRTTARHVYIPVRSIVAGSANPTIPATSICTPSVQDVQYTAPD